MLDQWTRACQRRRDATPELLAVELRRSTSRLEKSLCEKLEGSVIGQIVVLEHKGVDAFVGERLYLFQKSVWRTREPTYCPHGLQ